MRTAQMVAALIAALLQTPAVCDPLADPTRPPGAHAAAPAGDRALRVEAILDGAERRLAIIDGRVVRAGDTVSGARVEEIFADGVRYTRGGRSHIAHIERTTIEVRRNVDAHEEQR